MFWALVFVGVFLFLLGVWKIFDVTYNRAVAARAEKRAKEHFETTARFRRSIG